MLNACYYALPLFLCLPATEAAHLNVTLEGARAGGGPFTVLVFDRPAGFPKESRAAERHVLPAGRTEFVVDGLKPGQYAVMAYHDEDGNGELNRFLGMIPQEGWGLSNNPAVSGKPAFKEAVLTVPEGGTDVTIRLNY